MKVLQVIDGYSFGGIAKFIQDVSNNIKDIDMDFLTATNIKDEWINLGVSRKTIKGKIIFNHRLRKFLKKNKYDIIHINSAVFLFSFQVAFIAKISGIKKIIVHSHSVPMISKLRRVIIKILNPIYRKMTDVHLTCSNMASSSLYTKKDDVILIKNGIDIDKYKYNEKVRNKIRKELNINNKIVYGHTGRFDDQKNHDFLIDLFYELQKDKDSVLLLVGTGPKEKDIKDKVKKLKLKNVIFLGFREDIEDILSAMDIFIFPSLYEGLGISLIEAQTSGLPVVVSSSIPEEAKISNNYIKMSTFNINEWVNVIKGIKINKRDNAYKNAIKNDYDIKTSSKELEQIYKGGNYGV